MPSPRALKKLSFLPLAAIVFLTVSGGPYGLEPLLYYVGSDGAILLLLLTPLLWDVPTILAVLELNSMMPVTGGYYQWVKRALGQRWAFYEGWWTWLYTFVDLAIYPQLFLLYAATFFPQITLFKIPVCLCFIWACAGLNISGINPVGRASLLIGGLVLVPFIWLFVASAGYHPAAMPVMHGNAVSPGLALFTVMWNFIGWDNVTTYAEEVKSAAKTYIRAICIAFPLVIILYLLTIWACVRSGISSAVLRDAGFAAAGNIIGGARLATFIAAGGIISTVGLFLAVLLSVSRVPLAMSADGLLPAKISKVHARYQSPYISIIVCAVIVSAMVVWTFGELLIIDITIYASGLFLEFISLIVLRRKEPEAARPFRIPVKIPALIVLMALPAGVFLFAITSVVVENNNTMAVLFALALLASAEAGWRLAKLWLKQRQIE